MPDLGDRSDTVGRAKQQQVGRAYCKQAVGDDAGNLVDLSFQTLGIGDCQALDVENKVAIVGDEVFAEDGRASEETV